MPLHWKPVPKRETAVHSHDRTMLSSLGFADPDKKNPEHDDACKYLMQDAVIEKLVIGLNHDFMPNAATRADWQNLTLWTDAHRPRHPYRVRVRDKAMEYHLQKGSGQYATTIGFVDVLFTAAFPHTRFVRETQRKDYVDGKYTTIVTPAHYLEDSLDVRCFVEVKITPVSVNEILRQMNLYRSYIDTEPYYNPYTGLVITAWELDAADETALLQARYKHFHLGQGFQDWKNNRPKATPKPGI